jgi:hypothetical protein
MTAREAYTCPNCAKTAFPTFVLSDKTAKLVAQCANDECLHIDQSLGPSDFSRGVASFSESESGPGWAGKRQVVVDLKVPSPPVARSAPVIPAPQPSPHVAAPAPPTDVIGMIEERAMWLAAEEARLAGVIAKAQAEAAGVRAEAKRLTRMLRAAHRESVAERLQTQQVALRIVDAAS